MLFGCLLWRRLDGVCHCLLGFQVEDDSQDQSGDQQILQINDAADCAGSLDLTCIKCDRRGSVTEHLHNLSPYSLHSMIEGSTKAWHAILYGTPEFIVFHEIMPGMMKFGLFMGKIILEIVSEKYREEYREKYSELMEDLYELNSWAL